MIVSFDFETYETSPGDQIPRAVCMSWAIIEPNAAAPGGYAVAASGVLQAQAGIAWLRSALAHGACFVGAATGFDVLVSCVNAPDPLEMIQLWCAAYDADRVTDVLIRQPIIDVAHGEWLHQYALDDVCAHLNTPTQPDKANTWRRRYAELDGVPIEHYPVEAYSYSLEDAVATAECWIAQEAIRRRGSPYFPGHDILLNQYHRVRKAIALKDISAEGLRTNPDNVARFRQITERDLAVARERLVAAGLVRVSWSLNKDEVVRRCLAAGHVPETTPSGGPSLTAPFLRACSDPVVRAVADRPLSNEYLAAHGVVEKNYTRNAKIAKTWIVYAYYLLGKPCPMTGGGESGNKQPSLDGDACTHSGNSLLRDYSDATRLQKRLTTDIALLERASDGPFHAHYRPIQRNGRTSTGKDEAEGEGTVGNVQNMPRIPGIRECWEARPGRCFLERDWKAIQLRTFSQICYWVLGYSALGDMLNGTDADGEPYDSHLAIGAAIAGVDYYEAKRLLAAGDFRMIQIRTAAKAVNFGRKGMMGAKRFADAAYTNYGVDCGKIPGANGDKIKGAKILLDIHDQVVREMTDYSRWCQAHVRPGTAGVHGQEKFDLVLPWSGRCVAGLGYSDVHNYPFSALETDIAALALWRVFKAKMGASEFGTADPLYGVPVVLFGHDAIVTEPKLEQLDAADRRLGEIMDRAAAEVLPDCNGGSDVVAMKQLSKKAKEIRLDGRLQVWELFEQCNKAAAKFAADRTAAPKKYEAAVLKAAEFCGKPPEQITTHDVLRAQEWPEYAIERVAT